MENTKSRTSVGEQCSYYETVKSKQNIVMTLAEFVTAIRSDRWRQPVENYRKLMQEDKKSEAKSIKDRMPGLVVAGVCEGGHSKANFRSFSGCMMVDIDHYEGDVGLLLSRFRRMPWCKAGWESISGKGAKVIVLILATTLEEYEKLAYPIVARAITRLFDLPVDIQCKDLSRVCYASYDPHAFYKEECEVFPWREEAEALEQERGMEGTSDEKATPEDRKKETSAAKGMLEYFLERFLEINPYVPKYRHQFLLGLGREARRLELNQEELNKLIDLSISKLSMPDCDGPEIRCTIADAYRFGELNQLKKNVGIGARVHKVHRVLPTEDENDQIPEDEIGEHNREIRLSTPCLPDWIFDSLPELLKTGLSIAKSPRERDMLFLSMITNLSGCMPNVRMVYGDTDVYPHLFLAVIASSASGKGVMAHAAKLGRAIQKMMNDDHEKKVHQYEEQQFLWERERQTALKEKRNPDMKLRPEPLRRRTLLVPADISRTQLISLMSASPQGVLLNVSEMDTLRAAVNAEYGKFDDLMRACFHHEMFGSDFKSDKQPFMVYCPKMAFCASGTPSQFYRLCPSYENGSYSRYLIYMAEQDVDFRLMSPNGEQQNRNRLFYQLGDQVLEMYRYLLSHGTEVKLSSDQWNWHRSYFQSMLQDVKMEESSGPVSVVFRHGLNTGRLAMILTALRKFESRWEFHDITCSDEDFRIAMAVMDILLRHSLELSTSLRKEQETPVAMRRYFRVREALEHLSREFHYQELIDTLRSHGFSISTAKRIRARLLAMKIIEKEGDIYRFASRKWRGGLEKNLGDLGTR